MKYKFEKACAYCFSIGEKHRLLELPAFILGVTFAALSKLVDTSSEYKA